MTCRPEPVAEQLDLDRRWPDIWFGATPAATWPSGSSHGTKVRRAGAPTALSGNWTATGLRVPGRPAFAACGRCGRCTQAAADPRRLQGVLHQVAEDPGYIERLRHPGDLGDPQYDPLFSRGQRPEVAGTPVSVGQRMRDDLAAALVRTPSCLCWTSRRSASTS
ncbi:hypothetical protein Airi01_036560 [Actinoallomurus iriomotensis]|uniref:Uncharacterized protein n=1 Tax=Actinoallomurus iriomotensis TaxID=478107 RepID=A0A9W6RGZ2_9ACTN|nr:hypothetical protein Airi01_036560 [Actinoallomurus iriomotensis]